LNNTQTIVILSRLDYCNVLQAACPQHTGVPLQRVMSTRHCSGTISHHIVHTGCRAG